MYIEIIFSIGKVPVDGITQSEIALSPAILYLPVVDKRSRVAYKITSHVQWHDPVAKRWIVKT